MNHDDEVTPEGMVSSARDLETLSLLILVTEEYKAPGRALADRISSHFDAHLQVKRITVSMYSCIWYAIYLFPALIKRVSSLTRENAWLRSEIDRLKAGGGGDGEDDPV